MYVAWLPQEEAVILDKPEYHFALEEFRRGADQMVFLHLVVHRWTPSVYKEIFHNWKLFREHVTCPLYAVCGVEDEKKWETFVSRLGFKFFKDVVCENGTQRRLFIHIKNNKATHERQKPTVNYVQSERDLNQQSVGGAVSVSDAGIQRR